jgi:hypothetical protein
MARYSSAGGFDRHNWRRALEKRNDQYAQNIQVGAFFVRGFSHIGRDRTNKAVAEQDAKESSNQSRGDFVNDLFRRPTSAPMVMTTPRTAATIPRPGSESAIVESERTG